MDYKTGGFTEGDRVRFNPGYGADWTGTVLRVGAGGRVEVAWDQGQGTLWDDEGDLKSES